MNLDDIALFSLFVVLSGRSERFPTALVFDLDGTIVDTETVEYESIRAVWTAHGADYELERFEQAIGTSSGPDWLGELATVLGAPVDQGAAAAERARVRREMLDALVPRQGIRELMDAAEAAGIPIAVASNSPEWWVEERLVHSGLRRRVSVLMSIDTASSPKPHPAPFLEACALLGVDPVDAIALEDSATGVRSAVAAGLFTVACPGPLTRNHDLSAAHVVVQSHHDIDLAVLGRARRD